MNLAYHTNKKELAKEIYYIARYDSQAYINFYNTGVGITHRISTTSDTAALLHNQLRSLVTIHPQITKRQNMRAINESLKTILIKIQAILEN